MPSTEIEAAVAGDQRVLLYGVTWDDYLRLLAMRGPDVRIPRIAYLDGEVELMSPGEHHETVGTLIGRLLEIYAFVRHVPLHGMGSTTFRKRAKARGVEPDESYVLGRKSKPRPDLAIEVVTTSGGIDKLEIYAGLGVPEVWFWRRGRLQVHVLHGKRYRQAAASAVLPHLDLELLESFVSHPDQHQAVVEYARRLRGERGGSPAAAVTATVGWGGGLRKTHGPCLPPGGGLAVGGGGRATPQGDDRCAPTPRAWP